MSWLSRLATLVVLLALGFQVFLQSNRSLKLRVATQLFGWDGLANVISESVGERILGKKQTKSREAWHNLLNTLSEVELEYLSPSRGFVSAEDIAEGHRYLSHVVRLGFDLHLEKDVLAPRFNRFETQTRKVLGDNPDAFYLIANIDPDRVYRCFGKLTGEAYLSFTLAEAPCFGCYTNAVVGDINNQQLKYDEDGASYELHISKKRPPGVDNWLKIQISENTKQLQVLTRHYYEGENEALNNPSINPQVEIELVGDHPSSRESGFRNDKIMADKLSRVATFVREHTVKMVNDPTYVYTV